MTGVKRGFRAKGQGPRKIRTGNGKSFDAEGAKEKGKFREGKPG